MAIGKKDNALNTYEINRPKGVKYIWYILTAIEVLILLRVVFGLFGLEGQNNIISFINNISGWFTKSFNDVFGVTHFVGGYIEWYSLFAMLSYLVIAWAITRFFFLEKQNDLNSKL